jgi:pimeloyl-ACP methyl ester carboxylesterase
MRVKLNDITIFFEAHGAGKPLILLHGGFSSSDVWINQVPVFSQKYYVITPDSRAQGRTTDSDAPLTYHRMAEDTILLMDHLGIGSAYIAGWSDGASTGLDLAIHHPDRLMALVAYAATISPDGNQPDFLENIRSVTVSRLQQWFGSEYVNGYRKLMPDPERLPLLVEKMKIMWLTEPNFSAEELASIRVPTLIMDGENDDVVRPEHARIIADSIPDAKLVMLPGTGHFAVTEMPAVWNRTVLDFLQDK